MNNFNQVYRQVIMESQNAKRFTDRRQKTPQQMTDIVKNKRRTMNRLRRDASKNQNSTNPSFDAKERHAVLRKKANRLSDEISRITGQPEEKTQAYPQAGLKDQRVRDYIQRRKAQQAKYQPEETDDDLDVQQDDFGQEIPEAPQGGTVPETNGGNDSDRKIGLICDRISELQESIQELKKLLMNLRG